MATAVRFHDLAGKDLWVDEANGVLMVRAGLGSLLEHLRLDSSPPLYYILLGGWVRLFGDSEAAVRSLSIIPAVLTVAGVLAIGWRLFGKETGWLAAILVAVSPVHAFYSQQARMYTLLALLGLLSSYWLWRAIEDGRRRFCVAYVLATLAALYTHNFALHLVPAHAVIVAGSGALRRATRRWIACGAAIAVGYLPWLPTLLFQLGNRQQYAWYVDFLRCYGASRIPLWTLQSFSPGDPQPFFPLAQSQRVFWTPIVLFGLTAAVGLAQTWQRAPRGLKRNPRVLWLAGATLLPLAWSVVTSLISTPNWVPGRVDQLVFPCFVLLVATGLTGLRWRWGAPAAVLVRYGLLAVFSVYSCVGLAYLYGNQSADADRAIARTIADQARPGDAVLCTALTRAPLQYYLERWKTPVKFFSYPRDVAKHMGNQDIAGLMAQPQRMRADEVRAVEQELQAAGSADSRLFVVLTHDAINQELADYLLAQEGGGRLQGLGEFHQAGSKAKVFIWLRRPAQVN